MATPKASASTGPGKRVVPRLRELAPAARGSKGGKDSHNLGTTLLPSPVCLSFCSSMVVGKGKDLMQRPLLFPFLFLCTEPCFKCILEARHKRRKIEIRLSVKVARSRWGHLGDAIGISSEDTQRVQFYVHSNVICRRD